MKKLFILSLIAVQGIFLQGATGFKYLSKLDERSIIRKECEQLERAWFVQDITEIACDDLDESMKNLLENSFKIIHSIKDPLNKKLAIELVKTKLSNAIQGAAIIESVGVILPDKVDAITIMAELNYLQSLVVQEINEGT